LFFFNRKNRIEDVRRIYPLSNSPSLLVKAALQNFVLALLSFYASDSIRFGKEVIFFVHYVAGCSVAVSAEV